MAVIVLQVLPGFTVFSEKKERTHHRTHSHSPEGAPYQGFEQEQCIYDVCMCLYALLKIHSSVNELHVINVLKLPCGLIAYTHVVD